MRIAHLLSGVVLTSALGLQSCQQEPLKMPAKEEYAREFYKNFKNVDPDHDWNQAQKSSVTVKTSRPSSIKVMADIKGKRYLFADYREASGSNEIPLTLPKSVTDIIVKVNGQNFPAKLGATVDASSASSRIINGNEDDFTESDGLEWKIVPERIFATIVIQDFLTRYAENDPQNLSKGTNSFYFLADGKEHTFFPFYWWTNRKHCLGIYVVDDHDVDKITLHDLYFSKSGELYVSNDYKPELKEFTHYEGVEVRFNDFGYWDNITGVKFCGSYNENNWKETEFPEIADGKNFDKPYTRKYTQNNAVFKTEHGYISRIDHMNSNYVRFFRFYETPTETYVEELNQEFNEGKWETVSEQPAYVAGPDTYVRTRGITYKLPEGKRYGFYLKMLSNADYDTFDPENYEYDFIVFSNADRNKKQFIDPKTNKDMNKSIREHSWATQTWWEDSGADESDEYSYASWGKAQMYSSQYTLFGFEDWQAETNNVGADMNDIMFLFAAGEEPTGIHDTNDPDPDPEPEPYQWIIAAEDLGGSYDWDFNDVVAGVSIQAMKEGEKEFSKVTVTPLASGGTLPVYFMYTGEIVDPNTGETIANSNGDYVIGGEFHSLFGSNFGTYINASKGKHIKADPITFYTPADHSLASSGHVHYDEKNMGGFWVLAAEINSPLDLNPANNYGLISIDPGTTNGFNKISNSRPIASEALTAPQIICVEAEWAWPLEEKNIKLAYPEFETWVGDESHRTWINNKNGELTVDR